MNVPPPRLPGEEGRTVPQWFPGWAREFSEQYFSETTCLFLLHGNVHDLTWIPEGDGGKYGSLIRFLATQMFGSWDLVLLYDMSQGLRVYAGSDADRHRKMIAQLEGKIGDPKLWPRDPDAALNLIDRLVQQILLEPESATPTSLGVIIQHAQYLVPNAELIQMGGSFGTRLVQLLTWAQNPYIKRHNIAFCLLADQLAEVNERLTGSAHVATLHVPMPDLAAREQYAAWFEKSDGKANKLTDFPPAQLAALTNGLSLVSLERMLSQAEQTKAKLDATTLKLLKKGLIERQARGLVEFVDPPHTLDDFVGNDAVKQRLSEDAKLLGAGRLDVAPMGYLVCGPVGTGKTYLAECFAGSVGIPCVKLRNFRSKYVGETEGNLEQILTVLRAMGPVLVVIDEADAALGDRENGGDSGTSSRVFSMIAGQMGDTRYRGKLIWMLLTSRPDLLPIDLKRQGRAEVHLPLFGPGTDAEVQFMLKAMAKKNKVALAPDALPDGLAGRGLSGADIESIALSAKRKALTEGRETLTRADLDRALADFIPSAQGLEKEKQELAAVLECTSMGFLPEDWQARIQAPEGRARLQQRMAEIRRLIED
ncbi:ATP-binding protein [Singulisphaera sp. PoT]|uniref:ATP-binding protein n=1 Tax=Singulisphaera sp. PoT TaxID=3411797 RepID=UPI003BF45E1B